MRNLFTPQEIDLKIKIIAKKISAEHQGDKTPVVMVGLLNGAFMFYSDLVRNLSIDVECDFKESKAIQPSLSKVISKFLKTLRLLSKVSTYTW